MVKVFLVAIDKKKEENEKLKEQLEHDRDDTKRKRP
jgi:hypothetical protein